MFRTQTVVQLYIEGGVQTIAFYHIFNSSVKYISHSKVVFSAGRKTARAFRLFLDQGGLRTYSTYVVC